MLTKRIYTNTKKIIIFGGGTLTMLLLLLLGLSSLGVKVNTSGDQVCGDTCISYFNISLQNYSVCFGSTFKGVTTDPNIPIEVYKADLRYSTDNPLRWKPYNFTSGKCLDKNKVHYFKLVGHKDPKQTVRWGLDLQGRDLK